MKRRRENVVGRGVVEEEEVRHNEVQRERQRTRLAFSAGAVRRTNAVTAGLRSATAPPEDSLALCPGLLSMLAYFSSNSQSHVWASQDVPTTERLRICLER